MIYKAIRYKAQINVSSINDKVLHFFYLTTLLPHTTSHQTQ